MTRMYTSILGNTLYVGMHEQSGYVEYSIVLFHSATEQRHTTEDAETLQI